MKKSASMLVLLLFLSFVLVSLPEIGIVKAENWNWVEVARITGDIYNLYETEPFNISSSVSVWRIVWEYKPRTDVPEDRTGITINVYTGVSGDQKLIEISRTGIYNGNEQTRYFHEQGVFRLKISSNTQNFTVRIEQSMGYIPEPPSDNWVEVTRFIGTEGFTTDVFVCDHIEWRIRWEYDPGHWHFADLHTLQVTTYKEGESNKYFNQIREPPNGNLNGVELLNQSGTFYLEIRSGLIDSYTIIVEQNTESIPEPEGNWVEIITFTHSVSGLAFLHPTSHFTVDYVDWRIRWEVNPGNASERGTSFNAYVFPETSGTSIEEMHYTIGTEKTTGIKNIYNHRGSFYIVVQTINIDDIKLIIEQNIDSIPEFPSWTPLLITLITIVAVAVIYRRRLNKHNQGRRNQ